MGTDTVINRHYATLLGPGSEWKVSKVDLDIPGKRIDVHLEYTATSAICPVCDKLDMRPDFVRVDATV